jgi:hypothetical protein
MAEFLGSEGKSDTIVWVFKDDLFLSDPETAFVRHPLPSETDTLAEKVYNEGRRKGLVELSAIAASPNQTFVSIWYPRSEDEEIDGWDTGVKMSISDPLANAVLVTSRLEWWFWRKLPPYRRYQKDALWIGSRAWARA